MTKEERVQKIIAQSGECSRRKAEELIKEGKVKVNGVVISLGDKASEADTVLVNEKPIQKEEKIYYMLNKPKQYITTSDDLFNRKKVLDLVPKKPRVFAVGRLDRDATGLLLLTNDGDFANKIMHPRNQVSKTYIAVLDRTFDKKDITRAKKGVVIEKRKVKVDIVHLEPKIIAITLHVGIHKIVKRVCKALGYMVKQLHRTHIGNLPVDVVQGEYRLLTESDKKKVFEKTIISEKTFQ